MRRVTPKECYQTAGWGWTLFSPVLQRVASIHSFEKLGERGLVGKMEYLADTLYAIVCGFQQPTSFQHQVTIDESSHSSMCDLLGQHGKITRRDVQLLCVEGDVVMLAEMFANQLLDLDKQFVGMLRDVCLVVYFNYSKHVGQQKAIERLKSIGGVVMWMVDMTHERHHGIMQVLLSHFVKMDDGVVPAHQREGRTLEYVASHRTLINEARIHYQANSLIVLRRFQDHRRYVWGEKKEITWMGCQIKLVIFYLGCPFQKKGIDVTIDRSFYLAFIQTKVVVNVLAYNHSSP